MKYKIGKVESENGLRTDGGIPQEVNMKKEEGVQPGIFINKMLNLQPTPTKATLAPMCL